jgi:hypothetical protein
MGNPRAARQPAPLSAGYRSDVGDDGFPVDPRHPFNKQAVQPRRWR